MKKTLQGLSAALILACTGCRGRAVLYDSEETAEVREETQEKGSESGPDTEQEETLEKICVYVCGEVKSPGVYELAAGARVSEAVEAAGGMTEEAAESWLNLAEHMTDGQKIEVPSKEQEEQLKEEAFGRESGLVNLNTASAEQLTTLTGIGESKAEDILNYRETHGGFRTIEELMQIPGIKERVFEKIKDQITV